MTSHEEVRTPGLRLRRTFLLRGAGLAGAFGETQMRIVRWTATLFAVAATFVGWTGQALAQATAPAAGSAAKNTIAEPGCPGPIRYHASG
jgi:hypothetical protein